MIRHWLLAGALLGATLLAVFGDRTPDAAQTPVEPVSRPVRTGMPAVAKQEARPADPAASSKSIELMDISDRNELIGRRSTGQDSTFFGGHSWSPPPGPVSAPVVQLSDPAPPPLPFVYIGREFKAGHWAVFVSEGEATLILHESDEIDSRYRVDKISPPTMTLTYLPLNTSTSLSIE